MAICLMFQIKQYNKMGYSKVDLKVPKSVRNKPWYIFQKIGSFQESEE